MFAEISFPISSYQVFTYKIPNQLLSKVQVGSRVKAPIRNRKVKGIIVALRKKTSFKGKVREIDSLIDEFPVINNHLWTLINWLADYYNTPLGMAAKAVLPENLSLSYNPRRKLFVKATENSEVLTKKAKAQKLVLDYLNTINGFISIQKLKNLASSPSNVCRILAEKGLVEIKEEEILPDLSGVAFKPVYKKIQFSKFQDKALKTIKHSLDKKQFKSLLLHGVTGSGKTEIYIEAARQSLEQNKNVIVLLPEISLTPQIAGRFRAVFGDSVALWHSKLTPASRAWTWKKICAGDYKVVIGARSAIFVPLKNLGLIVVDEEQENSYKQESPEPRYHARDVSLMRGKIDQAAVVLASATPSLESYYNHIQGKFEYIHLPERFGDAKYPHVSLVDMIKESEETEVYGGIFSRLLLNKIEDRLNKNEQIILLHNRRGFAPVLRCSDCGEVTMCNYCHVAMTYHRAGEFLQCHFCNHVEKKIRVSCSECKSFNIQLAGTGTQKVEDELIKKFPQATISRLDMDTTRSGVNISEMLQKFSDGKIDILLGTQMIAKGLDFANTTLVGIINGDTGLYLPDFRAGEKVFQLIYQAAGRSGRGAIPGEVVVQTYNPDNIVIQCATQLNLEKYYSICLEERKALHYPPFSWLVRLEIQGQNKKAVENAINYLKDLMKKIPPEIEILGPADCYRERLRDKYRMQIVLKSKKDLDPNSLKLHAFYKSIVRNNEKKLNKGLRLIVDVNPVSLL